MKNRKSLLLVCIAVPLLTGITAAILTSRGMETFQYLKQPPLTPPAWLFPVVWTILYLLMGISTYFIITSGAEPQKISDALTVYAYQLTVNFLWPTLFFHFGRYLFSFLWLILLWVLILIMIVRFSRISKTAALLNVPYLLWVTFAGYLNFGIWWLNGNVI